MMVTMTMTSMKGSTTMTNPTLPTAPPTHKATSRPRSTQTGAAGNRPVRLKKRDTSLGWKSIILSAGVGATLLGSTLLTQIEQANAGADVAPTNQAAAVVQVVQALETARLLAQANSADQPRTVIVRVPVITDGGQQIVNPASPVSFDSAPTQVPAIIMPAMPVAPVFHAPITVTRRS